MSANVGAGAYRKQQNFLTYSIVCMVLKIEARWKLDRLKNSRD
jgi:hypothetical protein